MHSFTAIFIAAVIHGAISLSWQAYKKRQATKPITLKLRNGVHVPWDPVQRAQRVFDYLTYAFGAWLILLLGLGLYVNFVGPLGQ